MHVLLTNTNLFNCTVQKHWTQNACFCCRAGDTDLQNILSNMSQQQLMQLLGGMGGIGGLSSVTGGRPSSVQSDSNP